MNEELLNACSEGNEHTVRQLISRGADINFFQEKLRLGYTPLMAACRNKHENIVRLLIHSGVDINSTDNHGRTALHDIFDKNIVLLLIQGGIDINIRNKNGETALDSLKKYGDRFIDIIKVLEDAERHQNKLGFFYYMKTKEMDMKSEKNHPTEENYLRGFYDSSIHDPDPITEQVLNMLYGDAGGKIRRSQVRKKKTKRKSKRLVIKKYKSKRRKSIRK